jgi:hypothetical protein
MATAKQGANNPKALVVFIKDLDGNLVGEF